MAIKIYADYGEFSYNEGEVVDFFSTGQSEKQYDDDLWDDSDISSESSLSPDGSFYIVCDDEDEESAEEIAEYLGKSEKFILKEFRKTFFYIV